MGRAIKPQTVPPVVSDATLRGFSGYTIKRASNTVQGDLNTALEPIGLRMLTFSALVIVVDNPGLRQSQLADALAIERPNLVIVVDELEQNGWISRDPAPGDRRAYALQATVAGQKKYEDALKVVGAHEARMTRDLTQAERLALIEVLRRVESAGQEED